MGAALGSPAGGRPVLEAPAVDGDGNPFRRARDQADLGEASQALGRLAGGRRLCDVYLSDFGTRPGAVVRYVERHHDVAKLVRGPDVQLGVPKSRVRQSEAEGEQRCDAALVVPTVADIDTLG